jgi:hypothetical protein
VARALSVMTVLQLTYAIALRNATLQPTNRTQGSLLSQSRLTLSDCEQQPVATRLRTLGCPKNIEPRARAWVRRLGLRRNSPQTYPRASSESHGRLSQATWLLTQLSSTRERDKLMRCGGHRRRNYYRKIHSGSAVKGLGFLVYVNDELEQSTEFIR